MSRLADNRWNYKTALAYALLLFCFLQVGCVCSNSKEISRTEDMLGISIQDYPEPLGPTGYIELPEDVQEIYFEISQEENIEIDPEEYRSHSFRYVVSAFTSESEEIVAISGYPDHIEYSSDGAKIVSFCPGPREADMEVLEHYDLFNNMRHYYTSFLGFTHLPSSVYVGEKYDEREVEHWIPSADRIKERIVPTLIFYDIGDHDMMQHYISIDDQDKCNLVICDVHNPCSRTKLYWLIGDLQTGNWEKAWLVHCYQEFCLRSYPWVFSSKGKTVIIWTIVGYEVDVNGIYSVTWLQDHFMPKICLAHESEHSHRISPGNIDAAMDKETGAVLIVYGQYKENIYGTAMSPDGRWSKPTSLGIPFDSPIKVNALGDNTFLIRTGFNYEYNWKIKLINNPLSPEAL